jgi:hypothetical protein
MAGIRKVAYSILFWNFFAQNHVFDLLTILYPFL